MVKFHIGPGRRLGDSILLAVQPAPGLASRFPRVPTPPPAQPLRPGAAGRLGTGSLWPRAESRAGRLGCQPRGGGVCDRAGAGEGGRRPGGERGKGRKGESGGKKKKKSLARRKVLDHAGRRHESRRFEEWSSVPGGWLSPAGSARSDQSERSAARWRQSGRTALFRRGAGRGARGAAGGGGRRGRPGKAHSPPLFITRAAPDRPD